MFNIIFYSLGALILAVFVYWKLLKPNTRPFFLVLSGFLILYYFDAASLMTVLLLLIVTYFADLLLLRNKSRSTALFAIIFSVILLFAWKFHFEFGWKFGEAFRLTMPFNHLNLESSFPIGLSYTTFRVIHYLIERIKGKFQRPPLRYFLSYIFFFPIMFAGPIARFPNFISQSVNQNKADPELIKQGVYRIFLGSVKKIVIADTLASMTPLLTNVHNLSIFQTWFLVFAYSFQILLDFSAYSDIAIGLGQLFGIKVMENFNWPYLAKNISDFWKKWHISLTSWLRDYIFIPLGGSRKGVNRMIVNTLIVMVAIGLWHGISPNFFIWAIFHAVLLLLWRLTKKLAGRFYNGLENSLGLPITFFVVSMGWVLFAHDLPSSILIFKKLIGLI